MDFLLLETSLHDFAPKMYCGICLLLILLMNLLTMFLAMFCFLFPM